MGDLVFCVFGVVVWGGGYDFVCVDVVVVV